VTSLRVLRYPENSTLRVIDPVWGKKTTESSNKYTPAIVRYRSCQIRYFVAVGDEAEIIHQEFYATSSNGDTAFESIHWFGFLAKLVCNSRKQALLRFKMKYLKEQMVCTHMFRYHRLLAYIVEKKAASAVLPMN